MHWAYRTLLLAFTVGSAGCTYVTNADWVDKTDCLDEDGDGAVRSASCSTADIVEDCEDDRADRAPDLEEIPYDGIDNDCNGLEIVDVDGDGFPGILEADWVANDDSTRYPAVETQQLDCDDNNAAIHPNAGETYYDGIDSNCDSADDWDADGDGYVIRANMLPAGAAPYSGPLPGGDCDDAAASINPSVVTDALFDGVDANCDALNDYDGDGDTWMETSYVNGFNAFVQRFGYQGMFPPNFGDCNDTDPTAYPGAPDAFYDGIDSNCDQADDFDQDEDGYILNPALWPNTALTYTGSLPEGDCDDLDDSVLPGALERLGDSTDQDCDGGDETSPLQFSDDTFVGPRPPVVGGIDGMYVLVVAADSVNGMPHVGVALPFPWQTNGDTPPMPTDQPDNGVSWESGSDGAFGAQVDAEFASDRFFVGSSQLQSNTTTLANQLRIYRHIRQPNGTLTVDSARSSVGSTSEMYTGLDLERDANGDFLLGACSPSVAHLEIAEQLNTAFLPVLDHDQTFTAATVPTTVGHSCIVEALTPLTRPTTSPLPSRADMVLRAFGPGQRNLVIDSSTDSDIVSAGSEPALTGFTVNSAVQRDGIAALTGSNPGAATPLGVTVLHDGVPTSAHLQTEQVFWASATEHNGELYMVAVVEDTDGDGKNDAVLLYGEPANPTVSPVPARTSDGIALDAQGVSVWVDDDRVFLSVSGSVGLDDYVGWVFVAPPN